MTRTICLIVVLFLANDIYGRSILIPSDSPRIMLSATDVGNREHFDEALKRNRKSHLSSPLEFPFHSFDGFVPIQSEPVPMMQALPRTPSDLQRHRQSVHHHPTEIEPQFRHGEQLPNFDGRHPSFRALNDDTYAQNPNDYSVPASPSIAPDQPSYVPQYQPYQRPHHQPYATAPCGTNLLVSCQPQVRAVPCYDPYSPFAWPTPLPPPPPPPPAQLPSPIYSYGNRAPSAPAYFNAAPDDGSRDVYTKPGPPYYAEPNLGASMSLSSRPVWHGTVNTDPRHSASPSPLHLNGNQSSNNKNKTEASTTTEMNMVERTTSTTEAATPSLPPTTPSPMTQEQFENFADQLDQHVKNLAKFREMAHAKLRAAMDRKDTSDEELSQYYGPPSIPKRLIASDSPQNPQITNSVW